MDKFFWVFLGGGVGSTLRYSTGIVIARVTPENAETPHWLAMYPVATLLVNIIGCGLIGLAWGMVNPDQPADSTVRLALIVGLLGGFTTFSAFGWETLELIQHQRIVSACVYVLVSVFVGVFAAWSGYNITHGGS